MLTIKTPLAEVLGIGKVLARRLEGIELITVGDLLDYFPFRHDDFSAVEQIASLRIGQQATVKARVKQVFNERSPRRRIAITRAAIIDDSGEIGAVWFNQPFLVKTLAVGSEWYFQGRLGFDRASGKILVAPAYEKAAGFLPVYHESGGLTSKWLRKIIRPLCAVAVSLQDYLSQEFINKYDLIFLDKAVAWIHFPKSAEDLKKAKDRLGFDELFLIALRLLIVKKQISRDHAPAMKIDKDALKKLSDILPFKLTGAQAQAAKDIIADIVWAKPMNRLLEGDVGSGKTVVAAIAAFIVAQNGYQTAWLAPTEILANQHYQTLTKILRPLNVSVSLMTGTTKLGTDAQVVIGTHALLQENVKFSNLGLIIVDEQHRFGVKQRAALKSESQTIPHFLSMTATPIPRTLALALYGDLDVSVIDELPPGRQTITTRVVDPVSRQKAYDFIRSQVRQGRQVYVIAPLIEQASVSSKSQATLFSEIERKSAVKEYEKLSALVFPELRVGLLHGRMKGKDKQAVMNDFKKRKLNILVSTAVIEVGIDVPNATVMMIEDADRFGLAQLHQFRGRVGRGQHKSYCFLFTLAEGSLGRLKAMERYSSGFKLAEVDLRMRGPGELVGARQSGLPDLKMASLTDIVLIEKARAAAEQVVDDGIERYPQIAEKLAEFERIHHLE